ncbi:MAG: CpsD/CapB family tyrosine-protein kinase [Clostridia bacterium]|nr:CpsD/CapB family tyrosine-protein kinase [Clostridia bacterium]
MAAMYNVRESLNTPVEEAYRVLRTNIQFCGFDKKIKTLTITSCTHGEGKTTTAINLALSMAKSGMKVLLVDADLRKPMLMKHLGSNNFTGLSNLISGNSNFDEVTNATNVKNFYFIACGPKPPNPAEIIGSANFTDFLKQAEEQFDVVIIDSPPLGSVIDCAIIAAQTDGTLIVIESNAVEYRNAQRVKEQLEKANARILGVVLNKVEKSDYRNYYSNYSDFGSNKKINKSWFKKLKKSEKVKT